MIKNKKQPKNKKIQIPNKNEFFIPNVWNLYFSSNLGTYSK